MSAAGFDAAEELGAVDGLSEFLLAAGIGIFALDAQHDAAEIEVVADADAISRAVDGLVAFILAGVGAVVRLAGTQHVVADHALDAGAGERGTILLLSRGDGGEESNARQQSGGKIFAHIQNHS
jgi:hypothetical protein